MQSTLTDVWTTCPQVLRGHTRVSPAPEGGLYPRLTELNPNVDPFTSISYASFATRRQVAGGGFYDYTARYGGVREEDKITLRQSLEESLELEGPHESKDYLIQLTRRLDIERFLDLPIIALSNGQTRRAHIVRSLMRRPEILLLDEPLSKLICISNCPMRWLMTEFDCQLAWTFSNDRTSLEFSMNCTPTGTLES